MIISGVLILFGLGGFVLASVQTVHIRGTNLHRWTTNNSSKEPECRYKSDQLILFQKIRIRLKDQKDSHGWELWNDVLNVDMDAVTIL